MFGLNLPFSFVFTRKSLNCTVLEVHKDTTGVGLYRPIY